jgi:hypothetical protein
MAERKWAGRLGETNFKSKPAQLQPKSRLAGQITSYFTWLVGLYLGGLDECGTRACATPADEL